MATMGDRISIFAGRTVAFFNVRARLGEVGLIPPVSFLHRSALWARITGAYISLRNTKEAIFKKPTCIKIRKVRLSRLTLTHRVISQKIHLQLVCWARSPPIMGPTMFNYKPSLHRAKVVGFKYLAHVPVHQRISIFKDIYGLGSPL